MPTDQGELAWKLYADLRQELTSLQRIRAQILGLKIGFVGTSAGLIFRYYDNSESTLVFLIPGVAAFFFDLLVHTYSFSIKRTGYYCRYHLEPILRAENAFSSKTYLWEEFMETPQAGGKLVRAVFWRGSILQKMLLCGKILWEKILWGRLLWGIVPDLGTLGITILALILGAYASYMGLDHTQRIWLIVVIVTLIAWDWRELYNPQVFLKLGQKLYRNPAPAVAVLITRDEELLLAKRGVEPEKGKWDFVGGFVDAKDGSIEVTVEREGIEETGVKVKAGKCLGSTSDTYGDFGHPTINFCFMAGVEPGAKPTAQSDVAELHWKSSDELPAPEEMAFKHQAIFLEWWKKEIASKRQTKRRKKP